MASTGGVRFGSTAALHAGGNQRATAGNCPSLARRARLMVAAVSGNPARASRAPACANSRGVACCTAGVIARAADGFRVLPCGDPVAAGIAVLLRERGGRGPYTVAKGDALASDSATSVGEVGATAGGGFPT